MHPLLAQRYDVLAYDKKPNHLNLSLDPVSLLQHNVSMVSHLEVTGRPTKTRFHQYTQRSIFSR